MIVLEGERHKDIIVLSGLVRDQGPGPLTLKDSHSCGILRKKLLMCSGHADTSGSRASLPELPSQSRASVFASGRRKTFGKEGCKGIFYF